MKHVSRRIYDWIDDWKTFAQNCYKFNEADVYKLVNTINKQNEQSHYTFCSRSSTMANTKKYALAITMLLLLYFSGNNHAKRTHKQGFRSDPDFRRLAKLRRSINVNCGFKLRFGVRGMIKLLKTDRAEARTRWDRIVVKTTEKCSTAEFGRKVMDKLERANNHFFPVIPDYSLSKQDYSPSNPDPKAIIFKVDDVKKGRKLRLQTNETYENSWKFLGAKGDWRPKPIYDLEQSAPMPAGVVKASLHEKNMFVESALLAFRKHFPLKIKPDVVWITILQGFATHINKNPEKYRHQFVAHEGKKELEVFRESFRKGEKKRLGKCIS